MQDNAPIHNGRQVQNFLMGHGIWTMDWPPYSPDLNPKEHLWHWMKKLINKHHPELRTIGDSIEARDALYKAIQEAWGIIPSSLIRTLIRSMPRRLGAVRRVHGWHTKY